jgi:hypothetical protein
MQRKVREKAIELASRLGRMLFLRLDYEAALHRAMVIFVTLDGIGMAMV